MSNNNLSTHIAFALTVGIPVTITGYLIIIITRLFLFPTRVTIGQCFFVGLMPWWLLMLAVVGPTDQEQSPSNYDYDLDINKVTLTSKPEGQLVARWTIYTEDNNGTLVKDPIYFHKKSDKVYLMSPYEDKVTQFDYEQKVMLHYDNIDTEPLKIRPELTSYDKQFFAVGTIVVLLLGVLSYLGSLAHMFIPKEKA